MKQDVHYTQLGQRNSLTLDACFPIVQTRSYLEIADAIQRYGAAPTEDLHELWRRIVLTVLWRQRLLNTPQPWRLEAAPGTPLPVGL
jgi:hypothetical protein